MRRHILAVSYGGGHINLILPVLRQLQANGHEITLLALTTAAASATAAGIRSYSFHDFAHLFDWEAGASWGEAEARRLADTQATIPLEVSRAYYGINLAEMILDNDRETAADIYQAVGRRAFLPWRFLRKIVEAVRPHLVLTTNTPRAEAAALLAAEAAGIPSVRIEDLFIGKETIQYREGLRATLGMERFERSVGRFPLRPTRLCVLNDFVRGEAVRYLADMGLDIPPEHVVATGQPILDDIDASMKSPPEYALVPGRAGQATITWPHEYDALDGISTLAMIKDWFRLLPDDVNFILKTHPNFGAKATETLWREISGTRTGHGRAIHMQINPNLVLWNSHVVVGQISTMMLQASYMGRSLIVMDPDRRHADSPYLRSGVAVAAHDAHELLDGTRELADPRSELSRRLESGRKQTSYRRNAAANIANLIDELLS